MDFKNSSLVQSSLKCATLQCENMQVLSAKYTLCQYPTSDFYTDIFYVTLYSLMTIQNVFPNLQIEINLNSITVIRCLTKRKRFNMGAKQVNHRKMKTK